MIGSTPQPEHAILPALADRDKVLADVERVITDAWASFDRPRISEPHLAPDLIERLRSPLPDAPGDTDAALTDAARVLDASVSPCRPLYAGLHRIVGVGGRRARRARWRRRTTRTSPPAAGGADLVDEQALRWVAQFVGFAARRGRVHERRHDLEPHRAARRPRAGACRARGPTGCGTAGLAVYCSDEAHYSVVRAVEALRHRQPTAMRRIGGRRRPSSGRASPLACGARRATVADGVTPVAVVATAGTTLTGAVDPLDAIADVCARARGVAARRRRLRAARRRHVDSHGALVRGPRRAPTRRRSTRTSGSASRSPAASCCCSERRHAARPRSATRSATCSTTGTSPTRSTARSSTRAR